MTISLETVAAASELEEDRREIECTINQVENGFLVRVNEQGPYWKRRLFISFNLHDAVMCAVGVLHEIEERISKEQEPK